MGAAKVDRLTVNGTGIREGLAAEAAGAELPTTAEDLARRSVQSASEALSFSADHGVEVAEVAVDLFGLVSTQQGWTPSERLALKVAAWMHDSGIAIELWRHARHSSYLVRNFPIWGLEQREVLLAAMVTYLHEGDPAPSSWRKEFLPVIRVEDLETARRLGAILYAAEVLAPDSQSSPWWVKARTSTSMSARRTPWPFLLEPSKSSESR